MHGPDHVSAISRRLCTVRSLQKRRVRAPLFLSTFYSPVQLTLACACAVAIFPTFIEECPRSGITTATRIGQAGPPLCEIPQQCHTHTHCLLLSPVWSTVTVDQLYGYMGDRANALNSTFQSALAVGRMWYKINTWYHSFVHNHRLPHRSMYDKESLH